MRVKLLIIKTMFISLILILGLSNSPDVYASVDVWDVIRNEFTIDHEVDRPEVQEQIRWLTAHPGFLQKACQQSEPFIYHIIAEIQRRRLPGELALLPIIESAYDPFSYSRAGAAGIWQLMPQTGSQFGLKQDWWYDGRRSVSNSTDAALTFLLSLSRSFNGNWILAIASYDAGEGTISRSIKANQTSNFWNLPVPAETKAYVPRFLALAEVISNPAKYNINLPFIPYTPYFQEVNIGSQIDLNHAARLAGMTYKELIKLNAGFNRWTTTPYKPYGLLIPSKNVRLFSQNLANFPEDKRVSWNKHQVQAGDTLSTIATRYHTTANLIKQLNQLQSNELKINQLLLIPSTNNTVVTEKTESDPKIPLERSLKGPKDILVIHIVQRNDSYQKLQKTYGVSVQDIQRWNRLAPNADLQEGQQLAIWRRMQQPHEYIVKTGESLGLIARLHQTQVSTLLSLNPQISKNKPLHPGEKIFVG